MMEKLKWIRLALAGATGAVTARRARLLPILGAACLALLVGGCLRAGSPVTAKTTATPLAREPATEWAVL